MVVTFHNLQLPADPLNGTRLEHASDVSRLIEAIRRRPPFLFELRGDKGLALTIGLATDCAAIQHSCNGSPPYTMAVANAWVDDGGFVEFLAGGTPTPVPRRLCVPIELVEAIISDFLADGGRSVAVAWEDI